MESDAIRIRAPGDGTLVVSDPGIGLTEQEIHGFLATIGQSSKRTSTDRLDYLGQFGIGLLSCFVVSDEIEVLTRSARQHDAPTLLWRGQSDGSYQIRRMERPIAPGSEVRLVAKPLQIELFSSQRVRSALQRYGALLPLRLEFETAQGFERIDTRAPWRREYTDSESERLAMLEYGKLVFGVEFLDFIRLRSEIGSVDGIAYVLAHPTSTSARRADRAYLRGMLLSEEADNLLPDWAFFVKAVVDVRNLRPLASRESFVEDDNLSRARETLGENVKGYLRELAAHDPTRLTALLALHHRAIKRLAEEDWEFMALVAPWLPFETSSGLMTLSEYRERNEVVFFARTVEDFRQIAPFVAAQGTCVINAGYAHDKMILERFAFINECEIRELDASTLTQGFADLKSDELEEVADLVELANRLFGAYNCSLEVKRFIPLAVPAIYSVNRDAAFARAVERTREKTDGLWSAVLEGLARPRIDAARAKLTINFDNPLVRRLARVEDPELLQRLLEVLYIQTLLLGHHPLSALEMNLVNESLTGLIELSLDLGTRMLQ